MRILLALSLLASLACGDDQSKLIGVYAIDTWTDNPDSCANEGPSILEDSGDTHVVVDQFEFFGIDALTATTCPSFSECEMRLGDDEINLGGFNFEAGSDSNGWTGTTIIAGSGGPGTECTGVVRDFTLTDEGDGVIRIETEARTVEGFERDSEDFCDTDAAEEAARDVPCGGLEVLTATAADS